MSNLILQRFYNHPDENSLGVSLFQWLKTEVFKTLKYHAATPAFLRNSKKKYFKIRPSESKEIN